MSLIKDPWSLLLVCLTAFSLWLGCSWLAPEVPSWEVIKQQCPNDVGARDACVFAVDYASQACLDHSPSAEVWSYLSDKCSGYPDASQQACTVVVATARAQCERMHAE